MNDRFSKRSLVGITAVGLVVALSAGYFLRPQLSTPPPEVPENPRYLDNSLPIEDRVADLMSYMTLEEKIGQMTLLEKNSLKKLADISKYGLGGILSGFGAKPEENTIAGWKEMVEGFVTESKNSRLGIPVLYGVDAIHGHSNVLDTTIFPHAIGLGATGDAALIEKVARATADEIRATAIRWSYSPTYDMPEDIRWGRAYETFSDDPELVSKLGSAYITGLQTDTTGSTSTINVLATPKHYIGVGSMQWNTSSNKNFKIDQGTTLPDDELLRTQLLPPFKKAVESGAMSVMVGLNSWGDTKLAASNYLIEEVLKKELGFSGFVVSDWYGVYEIPGGDYKATVTAINAGVDMIMLPFAYEAFAADVKRAVRRGEISKARINDAVSRILTAKFKLGLFDETTNPEVSEEQIAEHKTLAREAVAKSLVLLKNDKRILPIRQATTIRVAGSAADNIGKQAGAWTVEWQGIDGNWLPGATSILAGIREVAPKGSVIEFDANANFATATPKAHIGIAVVGEAPYAEGWGDSEKPSLSAEDIETIEKLAEVSEQVVVVLVTGRPLIITDQIPNWDAAVVAWLPGGEGAGVADVLFGKKPFTGKLPLLWPASTAQLPIIQGKTIDGSTPLFPRYFGLRN